MSHKKFDENGFFTIAKNPISKAGVFEYLGSSIAPNEEIRKQSGIDANTMYKVYRSAEELEKAMDTLKLKPIIDDHTLLGVEIGGAPAEKKGTHGVLGEQLTLENDTLFSNMSVYSETLKELIENGKRELSCGFLCDYIKQDGVYNGESYQFKQTNLRANHIALVDEGRMGKDVAVLDSKENLEMGDLQMDKEVLKKLILEVMDESKSTSMDEEIKEEVKVEDAEESKETVEVKDECATPVKDAEEPKAMDSDEIKEMIKEIILELTPKAEDVEEKIEKAIAQDRKDNKLNQEIYSKASKIIGSFASDSLRDTVSYVTKKLGLKNDVDVLQAYLKASETSSVKSNAFDSKQNESNDVLDAYLNS